MTESPTRQAAIVGLFIAVGLAILAGAVLTVGNLDDAFSRKIHVTAVFDGVSGLKTGSNIWFSGVKVGTVDDLQFTEDSKVEVSMALDRDAARFIHVDSLAKVGSDGLIGNRIVVLYEGTPDARPLTEGDVLTVGEAVSPEDVLAMIQRNNENLLEITMDLETITGRLAAGEGSAGRLLVDDELYDRLNGAVVGLDDASEDAQALLTSLSTFSDTLNHDGARVVGGLAQGIANPRSPVGMALHDEQAAADLEATLRQMNTSSELLAQDLEALQHTILLRGYFKKKAKREGPDDVNAVREPAEELWVPIVPSESPR
jgi:phospholipid/cholesterol/gamma-HCH transport system substrate-binding protein